MAEETTIKAPKNLEEMTQLTGLKSTEASASFAKFLNEKLSGVPGFTITEEQAWALLYCKFQ